MSSKQDVTVGPCSVVEQNSGVRMWMVKLPTLPHNGVVSVDDSPVYVGPYFSDTIAAEARDRLDAWVRDLVACITEQTNN